MCEVFAAVKNWHIELLALEGSGTSNDLISSQQGSNTVLTGELILGVGKGWGERMCSRVAVYHQ